MMETMQGFHSPMTKPVQTMCKDIGVDYNWIANICSRPLLAQETIQH